MDLDIEWEEEMDPDIECEEEMDLFIGCMWWGSVARIVIRKEY